MPPTRITLRDVAAKADVTAMTASRALRGLPNVASETESRFAGLEHQRAELARAAVDLVATQLMQFESGVPETPRQILVPPRWVEGPSIK